MGMILVRRPSHAPPLGGRLGPPRVLFSCKAFLRTWFPRSAAAASEEAIADVSRDTARGGLASPRLGTVSNFRDRGTHGLRRAHCLLEAGTRNSSSRPARKGIRPTRTPKDF